MTEREQIMQDMMKHFQQEKEMKRAKYRQQNAYIRKGQTLFTGSSLMEQFPITEYCLNEGLPIAYNRGIGGYTTDEFLAAIDDVLLDMQPAKLFINIGTNDIRSMPEGEDWFSHLSANYRAICEIIRDKLPKTTVYMMAYYPVNPDAAIVTNRSVPDWSGIKYLAGKGIPFLYTNQSGVYLHLVTDGEHWLCEMVDAREEEPEETPAP